MASFLLLRFSTIISASCIGIFCTNQQSQANKQIDCVCRRSGYPGLDIYTCVYSTVQCSTGYVRARLLTGSEGKGRTYKRKKG
ncbi:uncharacterized protein K452DRAFT_49441 [Aplosporella prunicola CBS 121167]|uniref:Extracellular membrane protein CFEM domain-containing protein n=1 Tax=Aplosporella prunicola CBS 121167 TaxID=1176127 RepID=A0A6A6BBJ8_9PEZI|nr:uncharacterized protein K452DRAFT_49441 [Aplosporella prunicola CBS 121167]KAF2140644.1 hypothetical protein K452DRAFT_49441 [Aplosporella prunicola CBS 121167]